MSEHVVRETLARLNNEPVMVASDKQDNFVHSLQELRQHSLLTREQEQQMARERTTMLLGMYGYGAQPLQDKPFAFADGTAVIPVHGALINRYYGSWGYVTGYQFIRAQLNAALDDDDVKLIVFDVNSYGGEAAGCFELADEIRAARDRKPLLAMVDSNCCSAAYALGSSATKLYVTPSGQAGSIGVIAMHMSVGKALDKMGIEITLIYAGARKADGNPYMKLSPEAEKSIQNSVDKRYGEFVQLVALNRPMTEDEIRGTEAQTYRPDEALALKLIDAAVSPTEAVGAFLAEIGSDDPDDAEDEDEDMANAAAETGTNSTTVAPDAAALAQAAETARTEERARVAGILGSDEAKDRPALAQHLAGKTSMSVDEAKAAMSVAGKETAAAPVVAEASTAAPLAAAMAATGGGAGIGADESASDGEQAGKPSRARQAMANAGMGRTEAAEKQRREYAARH